ncbi:hypothetical protein Tco_0466953, partial [Tanacetum coccineum]
MRVLFLNLLSKYLWEHGIHGCLNGRSEFSIGTSVHHLTLAKRGSSVDHFISRCEVYIATVADILESVRNSFGYEHRLSSSNRWTERAYDTDFEGLHVSLDEIKVDKTLRFVEEPVEIM